MGGKYTDAQKRAAIKYMQESTDDIRIRAPKGTKEAWKAAAEAAGAPSLQRYIINAVEAAIEAGKTSTRGE